MFLSTLIDSDPGLIRFRIRLIDFGLARRLPTASKRIEAEKPILGVEQVRLFDLVPAWLTLTLTPF
jgi:hypothetical protein